MSSNTVLKKHFYVILGLLLLITGCATPLINAAKSNNIIELENLLNKGVNVNEEWLAGSTALYEAVRVKSSIETVRFLLNKGADVNNGLSNGWKPIHLAVDNGNANMVKLLLDYGADVTFRNAYDQTPLKIAKKKVIRL
jgi:ankyrin repeat protein